MYLDFSHRDILSFLNAKDLLNGDVRERLDCNIAIKLTNADIERIRNEEPEALEIFTKILELRMKYGSPYLQFMDNCWDADPVWYKDKEMKSGASQLCLVGETEVLTLFGKEIIKDLDGKTVEIFDGRRWVENKNFRKTGTAIALITIKVYGIEEPIVCTFNHEFPVVHENGMISKVKARNLTQKHRLILSDLNGREELKVIAIKHISIQFLSEPVDVYCTTVESTANFTLGCGILSGNCSEINLYHDSEHTYACVLSSLNVEKYQEWKDYRTTEGYSLPFLGIVFLDSVCEDLIARAEGKKGMENVVRGAKAGRPLGLGVLGLHGLYQSLNLPWESAEAEELNLELFQFISTEGIKASKFLAKEIGEPEWTKGYGMRNTHLFCCAPTTTNSVLCNASSPGIEPAIANYFAMEGAKGTFNRQNKYLVDVLNQLGMNNGSVWASIRENLGSVQHLEFLTEHQKNVFKTALEINQFSLIKQAADRQPYIDQGQSLNLFIRCTEDAQKIIDIHLDAADMGIKTLYYLRSDSKMHNANSASNGIDFVYLKTRDDCEYCAKAKDLLDSKNVQYITEYKPTGRVPEIWINGEKLDDGYNSLKKRFNVIDDSKIIQTDKSDCVSCEG